MSPQTYRFLIRDLGLTQEQAGPFFGVSSRTGQRWAKGGPPLFAAAVLKCIYSQSITTQRWLSNLKAAKLDL
jgi:hypothetical protein